MFLFAFCWFILITLYQEDKYETQISLLKKCNTDKRIVEIRFDQFSYSRNYEIVYSDSNTIASLIEIVCIAQDRYIESRVGELESCKMHIVFTDGVITLNLAKDSRPITSFDYAPEGVPLLTRQTSGLNFVFDSK